jgi:hypothetical protein
VEVEQELQHPGTSLDSQASRHQKNLERQIAETREALKTLESRLKRN